MKLVVRLLSYMRPYALYWALSVLLMAIVGALAAFRVLLIKPIIDNVLSAASSPDKVLNFVIPHTHRHVNLQIFIPHHFHNAWDGRGHRARRLGHHQVTCRLSRHIARQQSRLRHGHRSPQ